MKQLPKIKPGAKRRWRRDIAKSQKNAADIGHQADEQIEKLLLRRFDRLLSVRRFVFLWVSLFVVLIIGVIVQSRGLANYYQSLQPVSGGVFSEGVIGSFTNANPLYTNTASDGSVSHLVFSGLLKYDVGNNLVGDLAKDWTLGPSPTHYTVHLRKGVTWHDGQPFTAKDVLFTFRTAQNVEAQTPLYSTWKDITISSHDDYTVEFDLPNPLASFPYTLTTGILPEHLLKDLPPGQLRSSQFNTEPVGTGPFIWKFVEVLGTPTVDRQQRITMAANRKYYGGSPKLDGFNLTAFSNEDQMVQAFKSKQVNAMSGLEDLPGPLVNDKSLQIYSIPQTSLVMSFYNNSHPPLNDSRVRNALSLGVDRAKIVNLTGRPVELADGPLLRGQLGYNPGIVEATYNPDRANKLLDEAGWIKGANGQRYKDGQPLQMSLRSQETRQYTLVTQFLQQEWTKLGAKVNVTYYSAQDIQIQVVPTHDYDILVYGINVGPDPDVFAYWDSSQASISSLAHSNLSEYKSTVADESLEAGRTRVDPTLRTVKYKAFLSAWVTDSPALALYQPNYIYVSRGPVYGFNRKAINNAADRYYNVDNWMVRQKRQTNY